MPSEDVVPVTPVNTCFGLAQMVPPQGETPHRGKPLSGRAINVLRALAEEVMGEVPSCDGWVPPEALLRRITVERLSIARNCGPRTTAEIIRWAEARGVTIQPVFHAGKSLSETWRDLSTRFAAGDLTRAELAEALEKSVRRKSTKIPVADSANLAEVSKSVRRRRQAGLILREERGQRSTDIATPLVAARGA